MASPATRSAANFPRATSRAVRKSSGSPSSQRPMVQTPCAQSGRAAAVRRASPRTSAPVAAAGRSRIRPAYVIWDSRGADSTGRRPAGGRSPRRAPSRSAAPGSTWRASAADCRRGRPPRCSRDRSACPRPSRAAWSGAPPLRGGGGNTPAAGIFPPPPRRGGAPDHAAREGLGHALRSREQRGGRPRRQSAAEARQVEPGAADRDGARRGLLPPAGRRPVESAPRESQMTYAGRILLRPAAATGALVLGLALRTAAARPDWAHGVWTIGLWLLGLPLLFRTARDVARGKFAADLVAGLAIVAAMALDQPFAGLVIVVMQTSGEALEHYAERRASAAVRALEAEAPRQAHRLDGQRASDIAVEAIAVGDRLLIRPGEMVPCDGVVESGSSQVDASRLTGEPLPLTAREGVELPSGALNLDGPLVVRATARAEASLYARIVQLVRTAQASKAPLQRVADRYAVWFTPLTLAVAAAAYFVSGDPLRVLAVLVVATPCPLILATPVAIIGGINRAARRQIIVRHGGALEALAAVDTVVFDKTGTLTVGRPEVSVVDAVPPFDERSVLRLAGSVEQGSGHLLARSLVEGAERRGIDLPPPARVTAAAGGRAAGHRPPPPGGRHRGGGPRRVGSGGGAPRHGRRLLAAPGAGARGRRGARCPAQRRCRAPRLRGGGRRGGGHGHLCRSAPSRRPGRDRGAPPPWAPASGPALGRPRCKRRGGGA